MKRIVVLTLLMVLVNVKLIGQSDSIRINLPIETKIEVVKTLTAYPLVLDNLYLNRKLLLLSEEKNNILQSKLDIKIQQNENLLLQIDNLNNQKKLFKKQLTKERLKIGGIGIVAVIVVLLIN